MPVYPKKDRKSPTGEPMWRIVVWSRNQRHEKPWTGTKRAAVVEEGRWRLELDAAGAAPKHRGTAPTFSAFCAETYKPHAKVHLRKKTWEVRVYQLANLIGHLGSLRLTAIGAEEIDRYKALRTEEGAKPRTVNTELAKLQAVMTYAREIGVPCATPKIRRLPEIGRGRVTFWDQEQIGALFTAVEHEAPELLPVVVFLANTGCRKGEALAAEQSWIDLRRGLVRVAPNDDWQPKDNEPREIPISDALRPWIERALATPGRYVFTTSRKSMGRREKTRWACWPKRAFDRARVAAKLQGGPHTLRHSYAAAFLANCGEMYLLSKILGHASIRVTEKTYAHLLPAHLEKARNVVNVAPGVGAAAHEAKKRWAKPRKRTA